MRQIMVLNPKGGCGKSTIATSLASYYATQGKKVALADYDPQGSSLDWLQSRPSNRAKITGLNGYKNDFKKLPHDTDVVIIDAPARSHGKELTNLLHHADTILVPVLPSTNDIMQQNDSLRSSKQSQQLRTKRPKSLYWPIESVKIR